MFKKLIFMLSIFMKKYILHFFLRVYLIVNYFKKFYFKKLINNYFKKLKATNLKIILIKY